MEQCINLAKILKINFPLINVILIHLNSVLVRTINREENKGIDEVEQQELERIEDSMS